MKLIYKWLIVISLSTLLWLIHIQAGGKLSRLLCFKEPTSKAVINQKIIIKTRRYSSEVAKDLISDQVEDQKFKGLPETVNRRESFKSDQQEKEESKKDDVPQVPSTPPSKTASQRRKKRRAVKIVISKKKEPLASEQRSPRSEWDWCDVNEKIIQ